MYSYDVWDVHPDLNWKRGSGRRGKGKVFAHSPEQQLTADGYYADIANEAMVVGLDRSLAEQKKRGFVKGMMTQGGHGAKGSQFSVEGPQSRGLPEYTHQFKARKRLIDPEWEVCKWDGKFEAIHRVFEFDDIRSPYLLYNRLNDRVLVENKHYPIEMRISGKTCEVYLTTTYSQGVSELDFLLAMFLDKERGLMRRPDWSPVVTKKYSDGSTSFEIKTPEAMQLDESISHLPPKTFIRDHLVNGWELSEDFDGFVVTTILNSWSRVMDVVNSVLELAESAREHPKFLQINVDTVTIGVHNTTAGRSIGAAIDALLSHHHAYLEKNWASTSQRHHGTNLNRTKEHLADTKAEPTAFFLKNPLGEGMGPIRKVMYEVPADELAFQKRLAWGELNNADKKKLGIPKFDRFKAAGGQQTAVDPNKSRLREYKHNEGILGQLQEDLKREERMGHNPKLE